MTICTGRHRRTIGILRVPNVTRRVCANIMMQWPTPMPRPGPRSTLPARPVMDRGRATLPPPRPRRRAVGTIRPTMVWSWPWPVRANGPMSPGSITRGWSGGPRARPRSRPAGAATRAVRSFRRLMSMGGRWVIPIGSSCWPRATITRTARFSTRCTSTDPSARAACTRPVSPAVTATSRIA